MNNEEQQRIIARLREYCAAKGSQNKAANSMNGVSSATISKMLAGEWNTISEEMWRNVASQIGHTGDTWQIAPTRAHQRMLFLLTEAQRDSLVLAITAEAGTGKTQAVREYAAAHREVSHLCCSEHWNRRTFMTQLLRSIGIDPRGSSVSEMMDDIIDTLARRPTPLIVLDEADKLSDSVLYFFISLYNQLEGHCGILLLSTSYLEQRIKRGIRLSRKGYEEIFSRIGRKFVGLQAVNSDDIAAVCHANGVHSQADIKSISTEAEGDLRRVKRAVWAHRRKGGVA
jgi:hypothetical protein|nr:MAG TPA: AAA domain protein [Caudoviricetes sp.]